MPSRIKCLIVFILITFLCGIRVSSQNGHIVATRMHYGFIIPHSRDLRKVSKTNPWGIEVEWNWQLMSQRAWNYCYCFPRTGISMMMVEPTVMVSRV